MNVSRLEDGEMLDVNDAFVDMFGYSRPELVGRSPVQLGMFTLAARTVIRQHGSRWSST